MPNAPRQHEPPRLGKRHRRRRRYAPTSDEQATARRIRSTKAWQNLRGWMLNRSPLCLAPDCPGPQPAHDVHHIDPVAERPELAFDPRNCVPACRPCHAKLEREQSPEQRAALKRHVEDELFKDDPILGP